MSIEILKALVEIIKQGGQYAIMGVSIWMTFTLLKTAMVCWVLWVALSLTAKAINSWLCIKHLVNKDKVNLLSEKLGTQLCTTLQAFQENITKSVEELEQKFQDSKKN